MNTKEQSTTAAAPPVDASAAPPIAPALETAPAAEEPELLSIEQFALEVRMPVAHSNHLSIVEANGPQLRERSEWTGALKQLLKGRI